MGPPPRPRPSRPAAGEAPLLPGGSGGWRPGGRPHQPHQQRGRAAALLAAGGCAALLLRAAASGLAGGRAAPPRSPSQVLGWRGRPLPWPAAEGVDARPGAPGGAALEGGAPPPTTPAAPLPSLPPARVWPASAYDAGSPLDPALSELISGGSGGADEGEEGVEGEAPPPPPPGTTTHLLRRPPFLAANATAATPPPPPPTAPPPPSPPSPTLPPDFHWRTYLLYHPDLAARGITTAPAAARHYLTAGRAEGRPARRLRVLLRYTACAGLINQQYAHIAALTLAAALGADAVLPPAVKRDSFGSYFSTFRDRNEVVWAAAPLDSLLDVDGLVKSWAARGLTLHKTPPLSGFPDMAAPEAAFPLYAQPGVDGGAAGGDARLVTRVGGVYLAAADLETLVDRVRGAVMAAAGAVLRSDPDAALPRVTVDLPCTFFSLRTAGTPHLGAVSEVARSLAFAPAMVALADRVVAGMAAVTDRSGPLTRAQAGGRSLLSAAAAHTNATSSAASTSARPARPAFRFNGVHLRIESDARDWSAIMGGRDAVWDGYAGAMRAARFDAGTPLYAASGLLTYGAAGQMEAAIASLVDAGLASSVHYKELYLPASETAGLTSEQSALVDFLVLARCARFVGFGSSTFSFYLREHRALVGGLPRSSSILVDASAIGTDALFAAAGRVV